ncbi:MAG: 50S ribosomal protein L9 [Verrucomicrobia bacterium]|nr:50S ribosomal protein L9 [Verrucomicrobiota bacterium]MBS0646621.1 50S ribosomal protein L9 [Verrucomicrobiota bacterium]
MKQQLLLLEDVDGLGRSGDVVTAKPGFVRNFLLPKGKALFADQHTLKLRARLQEEREKRAAVDRTEAEKLAAQLSDLVLTVEVKTDQDGKMFGSVTQLELARLLQQKGYEIERKHITLPQAIKRLGRHAIPMRLKEGVVANFALEVIPEGGEPVKTVLSDTPGA